jgi:hypothetical protein
LEKTIRGIVDDGQFGNAVSISGNGKVVAGGATDANDFTGYVQVYEFVEESASTTDQRDRRQLVRSGRW